MGDNIQEEKERNREKDNEQGRKDYESTIMRVKGERKRGREKEKRTRCERRERKGETGGKGGLG